ncbi:aldehyde dehydrogenase [Virgibacillus sp. CBA3643]|uniref:aldehyde dehydrogenase n=1 Tax=Virgibacillus sp. CBA3643 TaxID=2942278 RepID=UPI0035A30109
MENYSACVNNQKAFFHKGETEDVDFRINSLKKLRTAIQQNENALVEALKVDLNKSEFEAYSTEIGVVLKEIRFVLKHLRKWVKPERVKTPITHFGSSSLIYPEPYGVALIIAPWNYPFQLAVAPLIGAIAAGNCAIIKPSELTPNTSDVLERLIKEIFTQDYIAIVQGDAKTSQALLHEKFNTLFFTGSAPVGKIVMEAAAKTLTPVTLELGGKSPCIVHEDANIKLAAKRIAWGKFMNAGQTCIAPDYVYVHGAIKDEFLDQLKKAMKALYGEDPLENADYTHIVNAKHFNRLCAFLDNGKLFSGGKTDQAHSAIEPTVLTDVNWEDPVMQDEIFGPVLPVLEYHDLPEAMEGIHNQPNPLALYLFSNSESVQQEVVNGIAFGGGCVNDTVYHFVSPYLPFGGIGKSGTGSYHGKGSFDTFSHQKSVLKQTTLFDIPFRYPNVKNGLKKMKLFLK